MAENAAPVEERMGVALSGGGLRASLFSLGVLIGLVDCGMNRQVTQMASVSGGSITSAAVAQVCDYSKESPQSFATVSRALAKALCNQGAFFLSWSALREMARSIVPTVLKALPAFVVPVAFIAGIIGSLNQRWDLHPGQWPWVWIALGVAVLLLFGLAQRRGWFQEAMYSATLAQMWDSTRRRRKLPELAASATTHVFIATDLVSGQPVYFARNFVACPAFGWGTSDDIAIASAVHASAAFPVLFPPRRMRRKKFRFEDGAAPPPYPRLLKLSDGGVHNNLGTDWFRVLAAPGTDPRVRFGGQIESSQLTQVTRQVVVNAGAASGGLHRVPWFNVVRRTMSILYDNTVQPRLDALRQPGHEGAVVIDIAESPYHLARRYSETLSSDARDRAETMRATLAERDERYWLAFARQTSEAPTTLSRMGLESGARMVMHGYLSAVVAMHVLLDAPLPDQVRSEGYFLDICGRDPRKVETSPEPSADGTEPTPAAVDLTDEDERVLTPLDPATGRDPERVEA